MNVHGLKRLKTFFMSKDLDNENKIYQKHEIFWKEEQGII